MQMPQPQAAHANLHKLAGTWVGEEKLGASPWSPAGVARGRYDMRVDLDGMFVIQDYVQERDGKVSYRGHGVFGWNEEKDEYSWYWVDSMGVPSEPSRGQWQDDTLTFEHDSGDQHGRYTYRLAGDDSLYFKLENSMDGGQSWSTFMEATYRRA